MGYDISLNRPDGTACTLPNRTVYHGSRVYPNGNSEATMGVTYNYARHFYRVMGEKGLRTVYGMTGAQSAPVLMAAILKLTPDETPQEYFTPTEGNARLALMDMLYMALACPEGVWEGD